MLSELSQELANRTIRITGQVRALDVHSKMCTLFHKEHSLVVDASLVDIALLAGESVCQIIGELRLGSERVRLVIIVWWYTIRLSLMASELLCYKIRTVSRCQCTAFVPARFRGACGKRLGCRLIRTVGIAETKVSTGTTYSLLQLLIPCVV